MKRKRQPSAILSSKDFETGSNSSDDDYQGDFVGDEDYNPKEGSANDSTSESSDDYVPPEKKRKSKKKGFSITSTSMARRRRRTMGCYNIGNEKKRKEG